MEANNGAAREDLLIKLTRLEDQVSALSVELQSSKEAVSLLRQSLTERDSKISELEAKLIVAQNTQLKTTVNGIDRCKLQITNGVDGKIIHSALAKIRQRIELMERVVDEAKDFINKKIMVIHENIQIHSELIKQWPEQARLYFEQAVVTPVNLLINDAVGSGYRYLNAVRDLAEQKVLYPGKAAYDEIAVAVRALPSQGRVIVQAWLIEPARQQIAMLPGLGRNFLLNALIWLKKAIDQVRGLINRGTDYLGEAIKNSSFWNGNNRLEAAY